MLHIRWIFMGFDVLQKTPPRTQVPASEDCIHPTWAGVYRIFEPLSCRFCGFGGLSGFGRGNSHWLFRSRRNQEIAKNTSTFSRKGMWLNCIGGCGDCRGLQKNGGPKTAARQKCFKHMSKPDSPPESTLAASEPAEIRNGGLAGLLF